MGNLYNMGTTADKLNKILDTKGNIKQAIIDKGVDVDDTIVFADYPEKISEIQSGGGKAKIVDGTKFAYSTFVDFPEYDMSYVSEMADTSYLFYYCNNLISTPELDLNSSTTLQNAFNRCDNITELFLINTNNIVNMDSAFLACYKLQEISVDTSAATKAYQLFSNCNALKKLNIDTSKMTDMRLMLNNCTSLTDLGVLDAISIPSATFISNIFSRCSALINFDGLLNIKYSYSISDSSLLTVESLMNCINGLADLTGGTSQTLTMGSTNLSKLTSEQIAIATSKNWTLA